MKEQILKIAQDLEKGIITEKESQNLLLGLLNISNSTIIEKPSPLKWLKEEKWKIPKGTTYFEPKVSLTQCAGWITEYVKKYCA